MVSLYSPSSLRGGQRPPVEQLSLAKRKALVACLAGSGALYRCRGAWAPDPSGAADVISGMTVADLIRDGLLAQRTSNRRAPAELTPLGKCYAEGAATNLNCR